MLSFDSALEIIECVLAHEVILTKDTRNQLMRKLIGLSKRESVVADMVVVSVNVVVGIPGETSEESKKHHEEEWAKLTEQELDR